MGRWHPFFGPKTWTDSKYQLQIVVIISWAESIGKYLLYACKRPDQNMIPMQSPKARYL